MSNHLYFLHNLTPLLLAIAFKIMCKGCFYTSQSSISPPVTQETRVQFPAAERAPYKRSASQGQSPLRQQQVGPTTQAHRSDTQWRGDVEAQRGTGPERRGETGQGREREGDRGAERNKGTGDTALRLALWLQATRRGPGQRCRPTAQVAAKTKHGDVKSWIDG